MHAEIKLNHVSKKGHCEPHIQGWPSTQLNRITHNPAAYHRAAHNPAARRCAGSVVCVTRMGNPLYNLTSQTAIHVDWANAGRTHFAVWANCTQPSKHTTEPLGCVQHGGVLLGCVQFGWVVQMVTRDIMTMFIPALVDKKLFSFFKWWRYQWLHGCVAHTMHNYTSPPIYLQTIVCAVPFHLI